MLGIAAAGLALLLPGGDTAAFPAGIYTFDDIARRLSLRASPKVVDRAAYISMGPHPKSEAAAIVENALGLRLDSSNGFLIEDPQLAKRDRAWREAIFLRLKSDAIRLVQMAGSTRAADEAELEKLTSDDQTAFLKSLGSVTGKERASRLQEYLYTSTVQRAAALQLEIKTFASSAPFLIQCLADPMCQRLWPGDFLSVVPITAFGPQFVRSRRWNEENPRCLVGWQTDLTDGRLRLEPVADIVHDDFARRPVAARIGVRLPGEAEARTGAGLIDALYGDSPVLGRGAEAWRRRLDAESAASLAATSGLPAALAEPSKPHLSDALAAWAKTAENECVLELSPAGEEAVSEEPDRYPNWRFRRVKGVLVPADLLGFWRRAAVLPMTPIVQELRLDSGVPEERQLTAFYRAAEARLHRWTDRFGHRAVYHAVPIDEIETGRPSFVCWSDLRSAVLPDLRKAPQGTLPVSLARLSPGSQARLIDTFRSLYPATANFLHPAFPSELAKSSLIVRWKKESGGTAVALSIAFPQETMAEAMASNDYQSELHFRLND